MFSSPYGSGIPVNPYQAAAAGTSSNHFSSGSSSRRKWQGRIALCLVVFAGVLVLKLGEQFLYRDFRSAGEQESFVTPKNGGGEQLKPAFGVVADLPSMPRSSDDVHVIFSTDCSPYQDYQSTLLFHSAELVGQSGPVTRIASGCSEEDEAALREKMSAMPENFRVHFTPDFSSDPLTGATYYFYNKPNGVAHFLSNASPPVSEAVIALVDPDQILLRKIEASVGNDMGWKSTYSAEFLTSAGDWVREGFPTGAPYGLGGKWTTWADLSSILDAVPETRGGGSPALTYSIPEATQFFAVGPPYLMHSRDWVRLIKLWVALAPYVNQGHPGILAEMYGFCVAAAHLRLEHRIGDTYMISQPGAPDEGWRLIEPMGRDVCPVDIATQSKPNFPVVFHYCQSWRVAAFSFLKRHESLHAFFSCSAPAWEEPPSNILDLPMAAARVHPKHRGGGPLEVVTDEERKLQQAFGTCLMLRYLNSAQRAYQERFCGGNRQAENGSKRFSDLIPSDLDEERLTRLYKEAGLSYS